MKGILQRIHRPPVPATETVTVCWSDTGLTFLRWLMPPSGNPVCMGSASLPPGECSAPDYSKALHSLMPALRSRRPGIVWFVMGEPAMALQQSGDSSAGIPHWMESCWAGIPAGQLPSGIVDGMDCLEEQLGEWNCFTADGHGFFISLHRRACLFAFAEGTVFRRVSRLITDETRPSLLHDDEWMQQTRMLYRNRTGLELHTVYASPGKEGCRPPNWPGEGPVPAEWRFLHHAVLVSGQSRATLSHPLITQRQRACYQSSVFRTASCILLGGWMLLLLGACRHDNLPPPADRDLQERWSGAVQRWQHAEKAWRANRHDKDVREAPFVLVGSVLQSVPPDIGLQRLHVSRTMEQDLESLSLVLEGSYEGAEASPEFREWVHSLQYLRILGRVENLRFERKDGSIHFHLTGQTGHGGWR